MNIPKTETKYLKKMNNILKKAKKIKKVGRMDNRQVLIFY